MPGAVMPPQAGLPNAAIDPLQAPPSVFDPGYFAVDASPGGAPTQSQFSGDGGAFLDRTAAVQHAATAIQRGADPDAVRARLHAMGHTDLEPPSPFSDLIPEAQQGPAQMRNSGFAAPVEPLPITQDQGGFEQTLEPVANPQQYSGDLQRRSDPRMAPQKTDGPAKYFQRTGAAQPTGPGSDFGRAIPGLVNRQAQSNGPSETTLTPWQIRRRNENAALLANPRIRAFLDMIAFSEGNTTYDRLFGNHQQSFADRSTHPGHQGQMYRGRQGGAAGRYQIMPDTYQYLNTRLGRYSMSDRDQDLMAVEIIREGPALNALMSGNIDEAISRLGRRQFWASFPILVNGAWRPNPSGQPTRNIEDLRASYRDALNRASRVGPGLAGTGNGLGRH